MKGKLYRTPNDKMILGVCGGLAEYFDIDSTIVRILFVVMSVLTSGLLGVLAYVILAIIMPAKPACSETDRERQEGACGENTSNSEGRSPEYKKTDPAVLAGFVFISIGVMVYVKKFMPYFQIPFDLIVPAVLIGVGVYLVLKNRGDDSGQ
jgi:phage shock protein C